MFLGTLGASLLENLLTRNGAISTRQGGWGNRAEKCSGKNRAGDGVLRACCGRPSFSALHNNKMDFEFRLIL